MSRKMSPGEEKGLRNLMKGTGYDKGIAEKTLKEQNPDDLSPDILNVWLHGKKQADIERAKRVLIAWGRLEEEEDDKTP